MKKWVRRPDRPPNFYGSHEYQVHRLVLGWLKENALGREAARPREDLFLFVRDWVQHHRANLPARYRASDRRLRFVCKELLAWGYPVFSGERGYYYGQDHEDFLAFTAYIRAKVMTMLGERREARHALEEEMTRKAKVEVGRQLPLLSDELVGASARQGWG
jgi:hypothetical protein